METQTQPINVFMVPPEVILADDNSRYGLKPERVDEMVKSILDLGGVQLALKVKPLSPAEKKDGLEYRLNEGHYRHAAALKLNKDQHAGVLVPVEIEELDGVQRLKAQVRENNDRENLSPMDKATAIKRLIDAGVPKKEICILFSSAGGRKGTKFQPMSNSYLNMHLMFLDFPKDIQERLHDGRLTVGGAYSLLKKPKNEWKDLLAVIEEDRIAQVDKEEEDEKKFLEETRKVVELEQKADELSKELEAATKIADEAKEQATAKAKAAADAYIAQKAAKAGEEKEKAAEHFKALNADQEGAEKRLTEAQKKADKLKKQVEAAKEAASAKSAKLTAIREARVKRKEEAKAAKKKAVGAADVEKAAKNAGVPRPATPLNFKEIQQQLVVWQSVTKANHKETHQIIGTFLGFVRGVYGAKDALKMLIRDIEGGD